MRASSSEFEKIGPTTFCDLCEVVISHYLACFQCPYPDTFYATD